MKLTDAQKNVLLTVSSVTGEPKTVRRLYQLGIYVGAEVTVVGISPLKSSLLVATGGVLVAIGVPLAEGICVAKRSEI